jgi:hypothetical protein
MSGCWFRGVVVGLFFAAALAAAGTVARAQQEGTPENPAVVAPPVENPPPVAAPPPVEQPPTQYAQAAPPVAPAAVVAAPTFMTLDRMDSSTRVGIQVGWDKLDQVSVSDGFFMRYEPYGQYVFPGQAGGLYGHIPISHVFDFTGADATGVGNLDIGGFFMPTHSNELILRGGVAFATASTSANEEFANFETVFERLTDLLLAASHYTTFRVSASTVQEKDRLFFRGDLGFDLVIDKPAGDNPTVFFRGNLALGIRATGIDVTLELVNVGAVNGNVSGGLEQRFVHTAGLSLRTQGENQLHFGTVFPLDGDVRGKIWILSAGYQRAMNL